jgi:hypothetical protein
LAFLPSADLSYDYYNSLNSSSSKGNATLFWACLGVGSILEIWGVYEWWDAASTLNTLRSKRYDISLQPTFVPNMNGTVTPGIAMKITF